MVGETIEISGLRLEPRDGGVNLKPRLLASDNVQSANFGRAPSSLWSSTGEACGEALRVNSWICSAARESTCVTEEQRGQRALTDLDALSSHQAHWRHRR